MDKVIIYSIPWETKAYSPYFHNYYYEASVDKNSLRVLIPCQIPPLPFKQTC